MSNDKNEVAVFAKTDFRSGGRRFGIKTDDRRRHMYIVGKTGMGKSVFIENLVYNDIVAGRGLCLVDPHGDTAEKIISSIPSHRMNDVIYFNPADLDHPIAFNVLEKVDKKYRHLVASGVVGVFKKLWSDSWGPRLEYLLRNAILALLDYPDSTLLGVNRMLVDSAYRKKVIARIEDPVVKAFWVDEYSKYNQAFMVEAIAPIQNKVGQFLSTSLIRNIMGQVKSSIDMRKIMDEGKILVLNLSKGRIGEDASSMLGAMLITKIQLAAMSRVDMPEEERKDFYLYVDEFQNFSTDSFANILSEARKYKLNLIIAHQYIGQLEVGGNTVVRDAVFGNVGTMIVFRVGATDAEMIAKEFEPIFVEEDFVNLPKYHIYLKLMIDGVSSDPFSAETLPPVAKESGSAETVIKVSQERYGTDRLEIEEKIARWSGVETGAMLEQFEARDVKKKQVAMQNKKVDFLSKFFNKYNEEEIESEAPTAEQKGKATSSSVVKEKPATPKEEQIVKCSSCGTKTRINFKPDPSRPVFCKECLKEYRREQAKVQQKKVVKQKAPIAKNFKSQSGRSSRPVQNKVSTPKVIAAVPSKEISLSDAVKQKPSSFSQKRTRSTNKRTIDDLADSYKKLTEAPKDLDEEIATDDLDSRIET